MKAIVEKSPTFETSYYHLYCAPVTRYALAYVVDLDTISSSVVCAGCGGNIHSERLEPKVLSFYRVSSELLHELDSFYLDHLGPDRQIGAAMHDLRLQQTVSYAMEAGNYEALREPLKQLIKLTWLLAETLPKEEARLLIEAAQRAAEVLKT